MPGPANALNIGEIGVLYFNGVNLFTGVTGTSALPLVSNGASLAPSFQVLTPAGGGSGTATAFTAGSIIFAGAGGVYSQDNANLFWDDANNILGIGTNTPSSGTAAKVRIDNTGGNTSRTALHVTGTQSPSVGIPTGIWVETTFSPSVGGQAIAINSDAVFAAPVASQLAGICFNASPAFAGNLGTLYAYGFFYDGGGPAVGTVDFQWGAYFSNPTAGNVKVAMYAANAAIGSYSANQPPSNGLIVSGVTGFGTNAPTSNNQVQITTTLAHGLQINGTQVSVDGVSHLHALNANGIYAPTSGAALVSTFEASATFQIPTGQTATSAASFHASPSFTSNLGTITTMYGFWYDGGGSLPGGTITTAYGGYFATPVSGSTKMALYSDSHNIGYTNVAPPSNGAIIAGSVSIGSSSATASAILALTSTTQGFLPSVMNTTQRNAIVSPATGLTIYNSSNLDLETYNGTSWIGASASGVTSIAGTANQISASASTGAVTLSLTNGISLGSYQATSSPTGGLIMPGKLGIGTSSPNASDYITISPSFTSSGGAAYVMRLTGITLTASASNDEFNIHRMGSAVLATTSGSFTGLSFYGSRFFGPSKTGNGTFSNAYGFYAGAIASIATNQYGGYFQVPTGGTVNQGIYSDNLGVGYSSVTPPSLGAIISGAVGIGTSGPLSKLDVAGGVAIGSYAGVNSAPSNGLIVSGQTLFKATSSFISASVEIGSTDRVSLGIGGTKTATDGAVQTSIYLGSTFAPTSNTSVANALQSYPQFNPPTGVTITTAYNILLQSGGQGGLGAVTTGVNLYVENPGFGTTKYAAILNGTTTINTSVIDGTSKLTVSGGLSVSAARTDGYGLISINETSNAGVQLFQTSNASGINGAVIQLIHTRGTYASPTATQSGDVLGVIDFGGYTNAIYGPGAVIIGSASQTWTSTAAGSQIDFYVTNNNSTSNSLAFSLSSQGSTVCGGNNGAAIATNATDGFLYIPSCAGTPTGVPTSFSGRNAMVYDTSANKLWIYNGSWRGVVVT